MAAFQNTRKQTEQAVMVHLLSEIEKNPSFKQRNLAAELGIALGLMNQYLKRCVSKGWVCATQISPRKIRYFLTPIGFKEKHKMVKDYLARSLRFFQNARQQCEAVFTTCYRRNWYKIALVGAGDLADIASLVARGLGLNVTIVDPKVDFDQFDAALITDINNPQGTYEIVKNIVKENKLFTLELLHISDSESAARE